MTWLKQWFNRKVALTPDGRTLLFTPRAAFAWGERVTVELPPQLPDDET